VNWERNVCRDAMSMWEWDIVTTEYWILGFSLS
jgi:hypothetical protein